jgi:hypothetical protein
MMAERSRRPEGCASDLELEELLAGDLGGPEEARLREHLGRCERCQARRAALSAEPDLKPDPQVWEQLLGGEGLGHSPRPRLRRAVGAGVALATAAVAGVLTWNLGRAPAPGPAQAPAPAPAMQERVKGSLALTVHVKRPDGRVEQISGQGEVRPGDEMRFSVAASAAGHAVVLGLDAAPSVTVYVPAKGEGRNSARVQPGGAVLLDGSVVADATAGIERVLAIVCPIPIQPETLRQRAGDALGAVGGRPEAVSSLGSEAFGCSESSVTLKKLER